jgi:hypothetical protein
MLRLKMLESEPDLMESGIAPFLSAWSHFLDG